MHFYQMAIFNQLKTTLYKDEEYDMLNLTIFVTV